jgi:hypothetical protein
MREAGLTQRDPTQSSVLVRFKVCLPHVLGHGISFIGSTERSSDEYGVA